MNKQKQSWQDKHSLDNSQIVLLLAAFFALAIYGLFLVSQLASCQEDMDTLLSDDTPMYLNGDSKISYDVEIAHWRQHSASQEEELNLFVLEKQDWWVIIDGLTGQLSYNWGGEETATDIYCEQREPQPVVRECVEWDYYCPPENIDVGVDIVTGELTNFCLGMEWQRYCACYSTEPCAEAKK